MNDKIARQLKTLGVRKDEVNYIYQGADKWVVQYRQKLCLIVANREDVQNRLETERRILSSLSNCVGLTIPEPVRDSIPADLFVYRFCPGRLFDDSLSRMQTDVEIKANTDLLSNFLTSLHGFKGQAISLLPTRNYFHGIESMGRKNHIREILNANGLLAVFDGVVKTCMTPEKLDAGTIGLVHGDFGGHNLLVGENDRLVTGVIDFTDCFTGDVYFDFRTFHKFGSVFCSLLIHKYRERSGRNLSEERIRTFFLLDAFAGLLYAIEFNRPDDIDPALKTIKILLASYEKPLKMKTNC